MKVTLTRIFIALCLAVLAAPAFADTIQWTDWTSATAGAAGSAFGVMGSTNVSYSGDIDFYQLGTGINYWTEGVPAPYTSSALVDNAPTASEMIALSRSGIVNTITFSTPVTNPLMAIVSQGRLNLPVSYDFNMSFTVISEGRGYWGDGYYNLLPGDVLQGYELHAVLQFTGDISSISWVATPTEYWHGFTVGTAVPEPSTLLLLGAGLAVFGLSARPKKG